MNAVKGRWGWYPCDYQTYLKLKEIKKRYWESVYADARYKRWERKLPKNRKGAEPPKPCPIVGIREWGWRTDVNGNKSWGLVPSKRDQHLLDWFELARKPQANEADVKPFMNGQIDLINEIYEKLNAGTSQKVA